MFILSTTSKVLEFWSVNHTSVYEHFELNIFKNVKFSGEIPSNWPNELPGRSVYRTLDSCW